ncbi:MAG: ABC transporter permease [Anaerolineae bacterium]|nr:ABC transporter permease [Anaerolineae bacterium]
MAWFILRRLISICLSAFLAITLSFLLLHLVQGDSAEASLFQSAASDDVLERRREALGLDLPVLAQYGRYLRQLSNGDLGKSWFGGQSVALLIGQQVGPTISLASSATVVAIVLGVGLGILSAAKTGCWVSHVSRVMTGASLALPVIFTGVVFVWVFSVLLGWLPATGQGGFRHLILPASVVGISAGGGIARAVDAGISDILRQPFMRTALAKGLSRWRALSRHGFRVGLLPVVDVVALEFGYLLGGTVITESLFARQGIGRVLVTAVLNKDIPVVLGVVVLSVVLYSLLNLFADVTHTWLDPRIRMTL